jgi:IS30 family transposase
MELVLHANATTTPRTRSYIQRSKKSVAELAGELGVCETTIRRWRSRTTVDDRSHQPHRMAISLSAVEETLVCELRTSLQLPLDDIVEVMRRCVNGKLSRSAIHRCLQRHGISQRKKPDKPSVGVFEQATVGFIHFDLKHLPALERRKSYVFVAIDRATRYVYIEILQKRDAKTSVGFLTRFLAHFPHPVHTILTDNGAEFTDRFAVDMKNKPPGKPSGKHPFDLICAGHNINHKLTRPYRPQTNGMVERFNRRLAEAIGREPKHGSARRTFLCHPDRDAFLNRVVADYNRTRLKCLGYLAPLEALANLPGPNTNAGTPARAQLRSSHAARNLILALRQMPFFTFKAGGYGSLRSQGRPAESLFENSIASPRGMSQPYAITLPLPPRSFPHPFLLSPRSVVRPMPADSKPPSTESICPVM